MKWFNLLLLCVIVLPFAACEQHPASQLELIEEPKEQAAEKPGAKSATEETKSKEPGPAPKYFQDSK